MVCRVDNALFIHHVGPSAVGKKALSTLRIRSLSRRVAVPANAMPVGVFVTASQNGDGAEYDQR